MKGKDPDKLLWHTQEGITIKPIYTKEDIAALTKGESLAEILISNSSDGIVYPVYIKITFIVFKCSIWK